MAVVYLERQFASIRVNIVLQADVSKALVRERIRRRNELSKLARVTVERWVERTKKEQVVLQSRNVTANFAVEIVVRLMKRFTLQVETTKIIWLFAVSFKLLGREVAADHSM